MAMDRRLLLLCRIDTIVHDILVDKLRNCSGIDGQFSLGLNLILTIGSNKLKLMMLFQTVLSIPWFKALGPLLFTLYTSKLIKYIQEKFANVSCHCYADDTQLYISFNPNKVFQSFETSLSMTFMDASKLNNDSKTT